MCGEYCGKCLKSLFSHAERLSSSCFNYSGLGGSFRIGHLHPPALNFELLKAQFRWELTDTVVYNTIRSVSKWPSAVYMSLICLIECSKMAFAHAPYVKFINGLLCFALKWLFEMCDSKFKELHTIFNLVWLFCAFHTCCLLLYPAVQARVSVWVLLLGLAHLWDFDH